MIKTMLPRRLATVYGGALAALLLTAGAACEFITPEEARGALEAGRELREFEAQEIAPRKEALDRFRQDEIEPRKAEVEEAHQQIRIIERDELEPLRRASEEVWGPDSEFALRRAELEAGHQELQQIERQIEFEARQLQREWQRQETALRDAQETETRPIEEQRDVLYGQLNDLHRHGNDPIEELRRQVDLLWREMGNYPPDSEEARQLEYQINHLNDEAVQMERALRIRIENLEDQAWSLDDQLQELYRSYEDQMRALGDAFQQAQRAVEDRRYQLQDERWYLDEAMQQLQSDQQARQQEIQAVVGMIEQNKIRPLKERARELEVQLNEMRQQERAMHDEIREVRQAMDAREAELEDQMFEMLESAVGSYEEGRAAPMVSEPPVVPEG